ncbi:metallophosphoesterase [Candidatus Woesearchaeota archaeon]|nr:metallophosphoesterase [Candidatus Woesearchaeota archaeon]
MRYVFCADMHGVGVLFQKLEEFSLRNGIGAAIMGGDICPHAHLGLEEAVCYQKDFIEGFFKSFLEKLRKANIIALGMMGNDDFRVNMKSLERLESLGLVRLLHQKAHILENISIAGYSFVPQMPFLLKDWEKLDDEASKPLTSPERDILSIPREKGTIKWDLENLSGLSNPKKTIYVFHSPPFNTKLDMTYRGFHVGSRSIRSFIEKEQPPLALHGHIHESPEVSGSWRDKLGRALCINPGCKKEEGKLCVVVFDTMDLKKVSHYIL